MRILKILEGKPSKNLPKILVTETTGHDALLDFMSVYQTQDYFKGPHYHPEGMLCWYSCNKYGDLTGKVVVARKVPIESLKWSFAKKKEFRMKGFQKQPVRYPDLFLSERGYEDYKTTKPVLHQSIPASKATKTTKGKKQNGYSKN